MLETVYVLPLMVVAILMIVEVVNFASDSLVWNENMNNLYQKIMTDANQGNSAKFSSATGMLVCNGGVVQPSGDAASVMQNQLFDWLKAKYELTGATVPITAGDITITNNQVTNATGQTFYVVNASYPVQTLVFPELKDIFKNIKISGSSIYEINFSCQP